MQDVLLFKVIEKKQRRCAVSLLRKLPRRIWCFLDVIDRLVKKDEKRIFIYSNLGFRDNVRAIFDHIMENDRAKRCHITVSLNDYKRYKDMESENVRFVSNGRGIFSFFRCRYCFYCFGKYPIKPARGHVVFNLWHGMPIKRIGNMIKGHERTDYDYFTHILCTSEFFRDIMKKSFDCRDEKIVICGQPRTDRMMRGCAPGEAERIREELFGRSRKDSKIILWLPTFRDDGAGELDVLSKGQTDRLDELCTEEGYVMLIKLHPLSKAKRDSFGGYRSIKMLTDGRLEELGVGFYDILGLSEALITDYSSVYFDYMLLDRPMAFVISDMAEYEEGRGFVFEDPLDLMPGTMIEDGEELLGFVKGITEHEDDHRERRRELCKVFNQYCDDKNCKRALEAVGVELQG